MDNGWLKDREGKPNLVALLSSAHEASLGLAQLHRGGVIHGGLSPAVCFLKAARNQRGFVVKVCTCSLPVWCLRFQAGQSCKAGRSKCRDLNSSCLMLVMTADVSSSLLPALSVVL